MSKGDVYIHVNKNNGKRQVVKILKVKEDTVHYLTTHSEYGKRYVGDRYSMIISEFLKWYDKKKSKLEQEIENNYHV